MEIKQCSPFRRMTTFCCFLASLSFLWNDSFGMMKEIWWMRYNESFIALLLMHMRLFLNDVYLILHMYICNEIITFVCMSSAVHVIAWHSLMHIYIWIATIFKIRSRSYSYIDSLGLYIAECKLCLLTCVPCESMELDGYYI